MIKRNLKIIFITQTVDQADDLLAAVHDWLERLAKKVEKLYVICLEKGEVNLPDNCRVISLGKEKYPSKLIYFWKFYRSLVPLILKKQADGVFVHMNEIYVHLAYPLASFKKIPIFWWKTHGHLSRKSKKAVGKVRKIFTASEESFPLETDKKIVTGHGIDTDRFGLRSGYPEEVKKILWVGRIMPVKHLEVLIEAADILINQQKLALSFEVVGSAPKADYLESLKRKIKELDLDDYFKFFGPIPNRDLVSYYQSADILVSTSDTRSLDKTVLEAMSSGTLVINSNFSFKEMFREMPLCQFEQNQSKELSDKIKQAINLPASERKELGFKLREIVVKNHQVDNLIDKFVNYISEYA